jgi:hypothetical protein
MIVSTVLATALVAAGLVWLVWFSSVLAVTSVRVVGVDGAASSAVLASADVSLGIPMARLDATAAAAQVRTLPWVHSVDVRRGWPHEVVIAVQPKVALARLATGKSVAADGTVFVEPKGAVPSPSVPGVVTPPSQLPTVSAEGDAAALDFLWGRENNAYLNRNQLKEFGEGTREARKIAKAEEKRGAREAAKSEYESAKEASAAKHLKELEDELPH